MREILRKALLPAGAAFLMIPLSGCFTGVEGTSKINLSKKDIIATAPTREELYLADISLAPMAQWEKGKRFLVADDKFKLVAEGTGATYLRQGDVVTFDMARSSAGLGGGERTILYFDTPRGGVSYGIDRETSYAMLNVTSAEVPMLIDMEMVENVRRKLVGDKLWTKTALWYGDTMQYVKGRKFVPVTVTAVEPGNAFFPLLVSFTDVRGNKGSLLMNVGNSGNESRNFAKLFSLSDPKNVYKNISQENWDAICLEEVRLGMTKEEVKLSKGNPKDIDTGHNYSNTMEIWYYPDGSYLRFVDGLLVGGKPK